MVGVNFAESVKYLLSLGNEVSAMKLGLENIRKLLSALGNPERSFLKVQVAGTNGKGSVCAFLDAICVTAGIQTGLYTSPHLISITERIRINGRDICEEDFARHASTVRETAERLVESGELESVPTFFEQVTAIALTVFVEANVDLAILETGLGGRLDATTAANAEIAAVTSIDYDHQEYLGESRSEIAAEKAAIIHEGSRVVIGEQNPGATQAILDRCRSFGIKPRLASEVRTTCGSGWLTFNTDRADYLVSSLGLPGRHQIENAKVAVLLAEILQEQFPITSQNIIDGLQNARHPGRLEFRGRYLFDGAHNVAGARALANFLDEYVDRPITLIFGAMNDKDVTGIAAILFHKANKLILTEAHNSRALTTAELAEFVPNDFNRKRLFLANSVDEAIGLANQTNDENGLIVVTGSLYLVGEAKTILENESET